VPSAEGALSLDHVGFVGRDMTRLSEQWRRLGFAPTEARELMAGRPGTAGHRPLHQQSCHIVLRTGYIELSAVLTDDPAHHLAPWRARGDGLHILALGDDAVDARAAACRAAGLPVTEPAEASRRIEYGTRHGDARFRWFMVQAQAATEGLVCYVRNETPELVYQDAVAAHANTAAALAGTLVATSELDAARRRWTRLLGRGPDRADAAQCDWDLAHGGTFGLATRAALAARFGRAAYDVGDERLACVRLGVRDLGAARAALAAGDVLHEVIGGAIVVPPAAATGAILAFSPVP
jgi:hypothetical protein